MKRTLREKGVDIPPWYLLAISEEEGLSQDALSAKLHIDKGSVARAVKSMEEKGYIIRKQNERDRRKYGLFLTDEGRRTMATAEKVRKEFDAIAMDGFSNEELDWFRGMLERVRKNLEKVGGQGPIGRKPVCCGNVNKEREEGDI